MLGPKDVLEFWLDDVGPEGWYDSSEALDATIREKFMDLWDVSRSGGLSFWLTYPSGALAYLILTDQFSRNMHRGSKEAFATDAAALAVAKTAISKDWDMKIDEPARQFFYMPLMHSENLCDQERCIRLMCERMPISGASNLLHARAHRQVIRQFGRFPYRNNVLQRANSQTEARYVAKGGYGETVRQLQAG